MLEIDENDFQDFLNLSPFVSELIEKAKQNNEDIFITKSGRRRRNGVRPHYNLM